MMPVQIIQKLMDFEEVAGQIRLEGTAIDQQIIPKTAISIYSVI